MLKVCPTNAITMQNGIAVIDTLRCIGCGRCALGLPSPYNLTLFPAIKPKAQSDSIETTSSKETLPAQVKNDSIPSIKSIQSTPDQKKPVTNLVSKLIYKVNLDACIGCQLCVTPCPTNAITMVDGKAVIDQSKCNSDGICVNGDGKDFAGCPVTAISTQKLTR